MVSGKLEVALLGELALRHEGAPLPLPASRKTRALFVYLLQSARPVRRERLCELFFDIPDDPRAALRWSLSKIRQMLGPFGDVLEAQRDSVAVRTACVVTDVDRLREPPIGADHVDLAEQALETPLAGLDLAGLDAYAAWLAAERAEIDKARALALHRAAADDTLTAEQRRRFREAAEALAAPRNGPAADPAPDQQVRFCSAADGVRIAYACTGEGPPLVKAANWLNHLELDWSGPIWGYLFTALSRRHRLVRYDERGNGLSDWDCADLSFEAFVTDLETVVEAVALDRFALFGISQGCAVSIAYAARHPERVSRLVLLGGYPAGWRHLADAEEVARREAVVTLAKLGWGQDNSAYRQIFSQTFLPAATHEELDWFNEFQRQTTSPDNAARFLNAFSVIDVRPLLQQIRCPTLVLHARGDQRVPIAQAVDLAAAIPGARLVTLDTDNHIPLAREPAAQQLFTCIEEFLAE